MAEKKTPKTMVELGFISKLGETLGKLDNTTRNGLAVEARVRPTTINDIVSGKVKQINLETLSDILYALNRIAEEKGYINKFNVNDIFEYSYENEKNHLED